MSSNAHQSESAARVTSTCTQIQITHDAYTQRTVRVMETAVTFFGRGMSKTTYEYCYSFSEYACSFPAKPSCAM